MTLQPPAQIYPSAEFLSSWRILDEILRGVVVKKIVLDRAHYGRENYDKDASYVITSNILNIRYHSVCALEIAESFTPFFSGPPPKTSKFTRISQIPNPLRRFNNLNYSQICERITVFEKKTAKHGKSRVTGKTQRVRGVSVISDAHKLY